MQPPRHRIIIRSTYQFIFISTGRRGVTSARPDAIEVITLPHSHKQSENSQTRLALCLRRRQSNRTLSVCFRSKYRHDNNNNHN